MTVAICAWDQRPIPDGARVDARFCSQRCRQAAHRFRVAVGVAQSSGRRMRLAYADPPYPGKAGLYRDHPDYNGEVDHAALLARLRDYDGWALSTSAAALPAVLSLLPAHDGIRIGAWVRGSRNGPAKGPRSSWEPVIYRCARAYESSHPGCDDSFVKVARPRLTDLRRVVGAKPAGFCGWLFHLLGARIGDELDDLYPGSHGVTRAWQLWTTPDPSSPAEDDASREVLDDASREVLDDASAGAERGVSRLEHRDDCGGVN